MKSHGANTCAITTGKTAKENARGRHYRLKSAILITQPIDPVQPGPSKNHKTQAKLRKLG
jgi:hypothetical protein